MGVRGDASMRASQRCPVETASGGCWSTYAEHLDFNLLACSTAAQCYYHVVTRAWCQHSKLISSTWLSGQTVSPCGPSGFRAIVFVI